MIYIVVSLIAYLIGSVILSIIIGKKTEGIDLRDKGSHGAGATNTLRTLGKKAAAITITWDILKGVIAVLIAIAIGKMFKCEHIELLVQLASIFVVIGHTFPVYFGFRGGKGVATSLGILLIVNWKIGLICLMFAIFEMAVTRMVSLGSISAAVLFPVLVIFNNEGYIIDGNYIIFAVLLAGMVIFNHRTNIKRIMNGNENKLSFHKKTESEEKVENVVEEKTEEK